MVLINRKSLIKLVICQLTCSFIIWISTKPLSLNHLQDLRLIKPRYDNLPTQINYQTTINSTIKIKSITRNMGQDGGHDKKLRNKMASDNARNSIGI